MNSQVPSNTVIFHIRTPLLIARNRFKCPILGPYLCQTLAKSATRSELQHTAFLHEVLSPVLPSSRHTITHVCLRSLLNQAMLMLHRGSVKSKVLFFLCFCLLQPRKLPQMPWFSCITLCLETLWSKRCGGHEAEVSPAPTGPVLEQHI